MKYLYFPAWVIVLFLVVFCVTCSDSPAENPDSPNVIFILADDLGFGDLACFGHPYAKTPHLDQLAREGILLKKAYSAGVTCAPSRAAFMTGNYPLSLPPDFATSGFEAWTTITEKFQSNGYITGHFGKWHMGKKTALSSTPYGIDVVGQARKKPTAYGKDQEVFTEAVDFIRASKSKPFYLNIWSYATHFPISDITAFPDVFDSLKVDANLFSAYYRSEKIEKIKEAGLSLDSLMRRYLLEVYALDYQVGRILKALDDEGISENTIIIFTSDHGAAPINLTISEYQDRKAQRYAMLASSGVFRGSKHATLEGGVRIPFIARWPKKIPAGQIDSSSVFSALDLFPTLCELTGIDYRKDKIAGQQRAQVWLGQAEERKEALFWKTDANNPTTTILSPPWKLFKTGNQSTLLYNLPTNPEETIDLSREYPKVVAELSQQIEAWENTFK